jgi:hypothetical protein
MIDRFIKIDNSKIKNVAVGRMKNNGKKPVCVALQFVAIF